MTTAEQFNAEAKRHARDASLILAHPAATNEMAERAKELIAAADLARARAKVAGMHVEAAVPTQAVPGKTHAFEIRDLAHSDYTNEVRLLRAHTAALPNMAADVSAEWARRMGSGPQASGSTAPGFGGYTIAPAFMTELLIAMKAQGGLRAASHCFTTDTGAVLNWPELDDRLASGRLLSTENTQLAPATDLQFTGTSMFAYTFVSDVALVSMQLMQDSAFDFGKLLVTALASRLARAENPYFTNGTGVGQPRGILLDVQTGVTGAPGSTSTITADNTYDLIAAVDPVYRTGARFMMNDATLQGYRKLKDTSGRPLHNVYNDPENGGSPVDLVLGYPVVINQDMPAPAANAKSVLFGNFATAYKIRTVVDLRVQVLRERYADVGQVGFIASLRSDGRMVSAATPVKAYQNSAS